MIFSLSRLSQRFPQGQVLPCAAPHLFYARPENHARLRDVDHISQIGVAQESRFRWFPEHARLRQGSGRDLRPAYNLRREPDFSRLTLANEKWTVPYTPPTIARFAQGPDDGSRIGNFWNYSGFGIRLQIIRIPNIFSAIVPAQIYWSGAWIIFKWFTALYVDSQNLITNRRNPHSGTGVGSEVEIMKATRYIYPCNLYCKPVNASKNTTKIHS